MREAFADLQNTNNGTGIYKTGWTALNRMIQGGFRPGETTVIGALQHKYKTGFTLSLFKQIALYNKPLTTDVHKKPLLLRISFEDDITLNLQFLYQSLKYDETREPVNLKEVTADEMSAYVTSRLQVNGFHIKLLRVDPSQWTYRNVCSKIIEFEAEGYNVELLMVDYLTLLPTTGCINTGPAGNDLRDMLRRMRNFCSARRITFITPTQLSTEAKQLTRSGIPEHKFVQEINEKGYFAGCKSLDNEADLILYIHIAKHNREAYLTVQRDKHRGQSVIPDKDKYFLLKFPSKMPIADDREGEDQSLSVLNVNITNANEDLFKLG